MPASSYPEHLTGAFTGGFGEETCRSCHFDYPLNYEEGALVVSGLPVTYEPGRSYWITIAVSRPQLAKAGFQMTTRFKSGSQAGRFELHSESVQLTDTVSDSVQYLQHPASASDAIVRSSDSGTVNWHVKWVAPREPGIVYLDVSANAANGDASEFGDYILNTRIILYPAQ
ncbi:MAG: choice-of-anchor V domain-containing protein [Balneolaceae bacterium]|nr:choice-of-anchor V domain-containing protein [Balneolaceae bacterium]